MAGVKMGEGEGPPHDPDTRRMLDRAGIERMLDQALTALSQAAGRRAGASPDDAALPGPEPGDAAAEAARADAPASTESAESAESTESAGGPAAGDPAVEAPGPGGETAQS